MPVSLIEHYKLSHKLILTSYKKTKNENKHDCNLMFQHNDGLRLKHIIKKNFYDIIQIKSYRKQQDFNNCIFSAKRC